MLHYIHNALTLSGATRSFVLLRGKFALKNKKNGGTKLAEKKKINIVDSVWELARPLVENLGLTLWDVQFQKEGANYYLRIVIDKEGGVSIDDCVAVNDAVDAPLDELDPISVPYNLQVMSTGIERKLIRDFHYQKFMGAKILLKLRTAYNGAKNHKGILAGYDNGAVTVEFADGTTHTFTKEEVISVKLDDFEQ